MLKGQVFTPAQILLAQFAQIDSRAQLLDSVEVLGSVNQFQFRAGSSASRLTTLLIGSAPQAAAFDEIDERHQAPGLERVLRSKIILEFLWIEQQTRPGWRGRTTRTQVPPPASCR